MQQKIGKQKKTETKWNDTKNENLSNKMKSSVKASPIDKSYGGKNITAP